jgi:hypothetical protein
VGELRKIVPTEAQKQKNALIDALERALGDLTQERCEIMVKEDALRKAIAIIKER